MGFEPTSSGATFRGLTVRRQSQRKVKVSNLRPVSRGYGLASRPIASLATFQVEPPTMVHGPQIVHKRVLPVVQAVPAEDGGPDPHTLRYDPFSRRSGRACPVHLPCKHHGAPQDWMSFTGGRGLGTLNRLLVRALQGLPVRAVTLLP